MKKPNCKKLQNTQNEYEILLLDLNIIWLQNLVQSQRERGSEIRAAGLGCHKYAVAFTALGTRDTPLCISECTMNDVHMYVYMYAYTQMHLFVDDEL